MIKAFKYMHYLHRNAIISQANLLKYSTSNECPYKSTVMQCAEIPKETKDDFGKETKNDNDAIDVIDAISTDAQNANDEKKEAEVSRILKILNTWDTSKPYKSIPGPDVPTLIWRFLPKVGKYHGLPIQQMHRELRNDYGDLVRIPGFFGRADTIISFKPEDIELVFRTEGQYPKRRGLETFIYYRKFYRPEIFGDTGGLLSEHGEKWSKVRTRVNSPMLSLSVVKGYCGKIDEVAIEFIDKMKTFRNKDTFEMPSNFGHELNCWALESIGVIALDERLGVLQDKKPKEAEIIINSVKDFFILAYKLDVAISFWKYFKTPKFYKLMRVFDNMTETINFYIDRAMKRLESSAESDAENRSILEKLLAIDRRIAIVMAFDMLLAGVDTTSAAVVGCLYHLAKNPEKQERLRQEIMKVLPSKTTKFSKSSLSSMSYMKACLKEALRLNAVIAGNARQAGRNIVLNGYQIPEGTEVAMANMVLQNDPEYFPKCTEFIPERWIKGHELCESSKLDINNSFVYLPFGFGPRSCIGRRFAETEIYVLLARIIRNFQVEYDYGPLKYKASIILSPDEDLRFKMTDLPY